jgi:dTDP-4-amino-4,6-dideoxygalactose transaminase
LEQLSGFLERKKEIFQQYQTALNDVDGLYIADVPDYADNNHWMNILQINSAVYSEDREVLMNRLEENGIQTRPVWALNHLQRPYKDYQSYRIEKAAELVEKSLCLPSGCSLDDLQITIVISGLNNS